LISLGIPKLVSFPRFHKIRSQQTQDGILTPWPTAAGARPSGAAANGETYNF
jgi:hypothetical protein